MGSAEVQSMRQNSICTNPTHLNLDLTWLSLLFNTVWTLLGKVSCNFSLESMSCWNMKLLPLRSFTDDIEYYGRSKCDGSFNHWWKCSPKQWQHLHHVIQVAVDTHCWISHLTASDILITISYLDSSPHQTWISSPVLVLLAYLIPFSLFPFLKNGFWIVPIPLRAFLEKLHWIVDGSAVGPCFSQSLLDFPSCFLKTQLSNNVHLP